MLIPIWLLGLIFLIPYGFIVYQTLLLDKKFKSVAWRFYAVGFSLTFVLLLIRLVWSMTHVQQERQDIPSGYVLVTWFGGGMLLLNLSVPFLFIIANHMLHKMFVKYGEFAWVKRLFKRKRKPTGSTPPQ